MRDKFNIENIKIIRKYFVYLKEAVGLNTAAIDNRMFAIAHYEKFINWRDFKVFNENIAQDYKQYCIDYKKSNGLSIQKKIVQNKLKAIRELYFWLYRMPAYQSHINLTHINYLKLDRKTLSAISMSIELKVTPIKSSGLKITDKGVHNGL